VRVRLVFPSHGLLGAECGLGDRATLPAALIGTRRNAAQHDALDTRRVGRAKNGTGVVETADVIEENDDSLIIGRHRVSTPNDQLPTSNHAQLPISNGVHLGSWELGVVGVGSWSLGFCQRFLKFKTAPPWALAVTPVMVAPSAESS